ncbi:hypothetical protein COT77_01990 [Candidatus Berkelbacteria bacterium CG10_big_fil_rev_8_21_14_0_10_41_12]|uniref:Uncharacterized protein n=1 Tax=Candidatus Berkelbacteria bacterium CG10_big_fil_rev_8_21_14_0_10_41_12 TaxID=1974513 RepID=A0A2M6WX23_9BACT|nr:MAG: hypothetical protein COT77_01990 [Candidatus Berkelbacteria bacterium CG10_big_fil_rev_8_21_14_0_10_41_12]
MKIKLKNKKVIILITLILVVAVLVMITTAYLIFYPKEKTETEKTLVHPPCLKEDEQADFKIERLGKYPSIEYDKGFVEVVVKEIGTDKEITKFKIDNIINPSHYHLVELHRCNVYVIRVFNYDPSKTEQDPGYKDEIWIYDYKGSGKSLILLSEKPEEFIPYYSLDFRIDPKEKHIILVKGYLGKEDYSLIIKDLNTKEDVFVLVAKEIFKQYPNIIGNFNMREWTKDGRYFWGDIFDGAYVLAYFRIDTQSWKYDIYEAPDGAMGGFPPNIDTGYVPIQPGQVWTGDYQLTQELKEQYRKEGKKSELYLYNLFTKEKIFIETTDEPLFSFKPKWISDTELEYYLPSGERRVYNIESE